MLSSNTLLKYSQIGFKEDLNIEVQRRTSYRTYRDSCRDFLLTKINASYRDMDGQSRKVFDETQITDFVHTHPELVEGFTSEDGGIQYNELIETLIRDLTDYGILTEFLNDPEITEIQINSLDVIFVEKKGKTELVKDEDGNNLKFENNDQLLTLLNRLINNDGEENKKISEANALVNAVSPHGYRIAVTDKSVAPPGVAPYTTKSYSVAIRKPNKARFPYEQLIGFGTLTEECARFLKIVNKSGCNYFVTGPTGSGKTALIYTMAENTPNNMRVLVIQSPSELDMTVRDSNDNIKNNVVHWEARDANRPSTGTPTIKNCISHSLRFTPHKVIVGEVRKPDEFFELIREGLTGHIVVSSFHAHNVKQAIERAVSEIAPLVNDIELSYRYICTTMNFIIVQKRLPDGTRKILEVAEIVGYDAVLHEPIINMIFKFKPTGEILYSDGTTIYSPEKTIKLILGKLERVGHLTSDRLDLMLLQGIALEEVREFVLDEDIEKVVSKR